MESGYLPPNINFSTPREGVLGFEEGRLQVVTEKTPWPGGLIGINSFGFGGANCHVLLKSNPKEKVNGGRPKDNLPRLVAVSGRTNEAVDSLLDDVSLQLVPDGHIPVVSFSSRNTYSRQLCPTLRDSWIQSFKEAEKFHSPLFKQN